MPLRAPDHHAAARSEKRAQRSPRPRRWRVHQRAVARGQNVGGDGVTQDAIEARPVEQPDRGLCAPGLRERTSLVPASQECRVRRLLQPACEHGHSGAPARGWMQGPPVASMPARMGHGRRADTHGHAKASESAGPIRARAHQGAVQVGVLSTRDERSHRLLAVHRACVVCVQSDAAPAPRPSRVHRHVRCVRRDRAERADLRRRERRGQRHRSYDAERRARPSTRSTCPTGWGCRCGQEEQEAARAARRARDRPRGGHACRRARALGDVTRRSDSARRRPSG